MTMLARTPSVVLNSQKSPASAAEINFSRNSKRAFAVQHRPDGQHAVSIEVIVRDEIDPLRQLIAVRRGDNIQRDLSRGIGLH